MKPHLTRGGPEDSPAAAAADPLNGLFGLIDLLTDRVAGLMLERLPLLRGGAGDDDELLSYQQVADLLTTMEVQVQAGTSPSKTAWLASADTAESDLDRLALAQGEELRTAFRAHSTRVRRLLDEFRLLVPAELM